MRYEYGAAPQPAYICKRHDAFVFMYVDSRRSESFEDQSADRAARCVLGATRLTSRTRGFALRDVTDFRERKHYRDITRIPT